MPCAKAACLHIGRTYQYLSFSFLIRMGIFNTCKKTIIFSHFNIQKHKSDYGNINDSLSAKGIEKVRIK